MNVIDLYIQNISSILVLSCVRTLQKNRFDVILIECKQDFDVTATEHFLRISDFQREDS